MAKSEKEIEIIIEGKEWEEALDKAFKKANKKAKIDGFRPGKAPKDVFIKHYGKESLYMDAADYAADIAYQKLLKDYADDVKELVARPDIALTNIDDKKVTFKFTLTMRPEVKLGKYKGLGVKKDEVKASEDEIEDAIKHMRERYAEDVLKDGAIADGDIAVIDFEGFIDGKAFEGGKSENYSLKIGSGTFIPGFEEGLIGLKSGDKKDVKVTFPEDYHAEDLKGKEATFKVTVPIALHVHQDTEGVKTYADAMNAENATGTAKIINECSMGQVKITDVKVVAAEGYTISAWDADYNNMKVNSKTFGFKINGVETQTNGTVVTSNAVTDTITTTVKNNEDSKTDLTRVYGDYNITPSGDSAFPVIAHASVLPIDYEAKLPAYSDAVTDTNVGAVVFTVDFN